MKRRYEMGIMDLYPVIANNKNVCCDVGDRLPRTHAV